MLVKTVISAGKSDIVAEEAGWAPAGSGRGSSLVRRPLLCGLCSHLQARDDQPWVQMLRNKALSRKTHR